MAPSSTPHPVPPYVAPKRKNNSALWLALGIVSFLGLSFIGLALIAALAGDVAKPSVGLIEVSGPITDSGASGLLGGTSGGARDFIREVETARQDPQIKSVVIRINSPGGSASASQEMYGAVMRLREEKPVIASMGDVAASGGYYVAAACDKIYANRATTTGSIGVITQLLNYQDLFDKLGLDEATIKSGKFKDAGNPARPLTPEERQLFQGLINNLYNQFVNDIVAGRKEATNGKLTRAKLIPLADGRVFTGEQAAKNGLIDATDDLYAAVKFAAREGGLSEEDTPITPLSDGGGLGALFGASSRGPIGSAVDGLSQIAGAAFARGALGQVKSEAKDLPTTKF